MATLKFLAVLAVLVLAGLGCLFVLDLIPRETLETLSVKTAVVLGILGAASFVIGLLMKRSGE